MGKSITRASIEAASTMVTCWGYHKRGLWGLGYRGECFVIEIHESTSEAITEARGK